MADFTPTDLITLSKALKCYQDAPANWKASPDDPGKPSQGEMMQTQATLLHHLCVASVSTGDRLCTMLADEGLPPAKDGQKSLYRVLLGLEHMGDIEPIFENDDKGRFCISLKYGVDAQQVITCWYLTNRELQHEVLSEALHGKESLLGRTLMDTQSAGCIVVDALMDKAMEYAQADPAWEKLIQDITERERS